jgi:hypothetical protein
MNTTFDSEVDNRLDPTHPTPGRFALWFGVLGPPVTWMAHLGAGWLLTEFGCARGANNMITLNIGLTTVLALVVIVFAAFGAARAHRAYAGVDDDAPESDPTPDDPEEQRAERIRFMTLVSIGFAMIFGALVVYSTIPALVLSPCTGGVGS